jgi:putative membrane protein
VTRNLTHADHERIAEAVTEAEAHTTGEIACILAEEASLYPETPIAWGAIAALGLAPLLALGAAPIWSSFGPTAWSAGHAAAADTQIAFALTAFVLLQGVLFAVAAGVTAIPEVRRAVTPAFLKRRKAARNARQQFALVSSTIADAEALVLIFVSRHDHHVQVLAGAGIHEKAGGDPWRAAVQAVQAGMKADDPVSGLVNAVGLVGEVLAKHFPAEGPDPNRMANRPVELS